VSDRAQLGEVVSTSLIDSFIVGADGLRIAPGSPFAAEGVGPVGSEFHPTNPEQLYVSNALGGREAGSVSAFIDGADCTLTPIGASPFPNYQTAPCWIEISHDGRYLFVVNTDSKSISSYSLERRLAQSSRDDAGERSNRSTRRRAALS
jgi:6-phosphogluconolactonase (cycloisomerase 2 family)